MNITFVGAGNLATNLAVALKVKHNITCVYSRTMESAKCLADRVGGIPVNDIRDIKRGADIYIIAVKDDIIQDVAKQLANLAKDALVVHTAGTVGINALPTKRRGVFYPMQTFSKQRILDFEDIPIFIEANQQTDIDILNNLASSISNRVMIVDGEQRKILHLAAVFCCNFFNHCAAISQDILERFNIPFNVMLPLINETCQKMNVLKPKQSQTGPAVRNDKSVMTAHIDMLNSINASKWTKIYELISESIQEMANK